MGFNGVGTKEIKRGNVDKGAQGPITLKQTFIQSLLPLSAAYKPLFKAIKSSYRLRPVHEAI